jgi:hypothetical protein
MVLVGEMLHSFVPPLIVAEINELFEQHGTVLTGDSWNAAIGSTATVRSMARGAGLEELRTTLSVRSQSRGGQKLLPRRQRARLWSGSVHAGEYAIEHTGRHPNVSAPIS